MTTDSFKNVLLHDGEGDRHRLRGALGIHLPAAVVDDAGVVRYRVDRGGYDEDLEPAAALAEWANTDEGRAFASPPAPRVNGASRLRAGVAEALGARDGSSAKQQLVEGVLAELGDGASISFR